MTSSNVLQSATCTERQHVTLDPTKFLRMHMQQKPLRNSQGTSKTTVERDLDLLTISTAGA